MCSGTDVSCFKKWGKSKNFFGNSKVFESTSEETSWLSMTACPFLVYCLPSTLTFLRWNFRLFSRGVMIHFGNNLNHIIISGC